MSLIPLPLKSLERLPLTSMTHNLDTEPLEVLTFETLKQDPFCIAVEPNPNLIDVNGSLTVGSLGSSRDFFEF